MNNENPNIYQELKEANIDNFEHSLAADPNDMPPEIFTEPNQDLEEFDDAEITVVNVMSDYSLSTKNGGKIDKINEAGQMLISALAHPETANRIYITQFGFNDTASRLSFLERASEARFRHLEASGNTSFNNALQAGLKSIIEGESHNFGEDRELKEQIVIFLSDGESPVDQGIIRQVQTKAKIFAIGFGEDADMTTLSLIDSSGKARFASTDKHDLKDLFHSIGVKVSERAMGYDDDE